MTIMIKDLPKPSLWDLLLFTYLLSLIRPFVTPWSDYSPSDSSVNGISQAKIVEWAAISFFFPGIFPTWRSILWQQADSLPLSH